MHSRFRNINKIVVCSIALVLHLTVIFAGCSIEPNKDGHVDIPDDWTSIEDGAFTSCSSLITFYIPTSVTTIGYKSFEDCTELKSVTIPDSVTIIGGDAFYKCTSLKSVTIGNGIKSVGANAFARCPHIKVASIGRNVTNLSVDISPHCQMGFPGEYIKVPTLSEESVLMSNLIREARRSSRYAKSWSKYYNDFALFLRSHFGGRSVDIIEIGTCFGGNALTIMKSMPSSMLHIVDPFLPNYDPRDSISRRFNEYATERNMTAEKFSRVWADALFHEMRTKFGCRYHLYHNYSIAAAASFPDVFADAIFIDGLHTYEGVKEDIDAWTKKTKVGGILVFNDYNSKKFPGVKKAVDEFTTKHSLRLVVGGTGSGPGSSNAFFVNLDGKT